MKYLITLTALLISLAASASYPAYVHLDHNTIEMNGDDWTGLAATLGGADSLRVNIVHIGDSHLQADMATAVTRQRLGERYGSGGRSLVVPFKLAGTNEPLDYAITSSTPMLGSRLLKTPWTAPMGFTGISVMPKSGDFELTLSAREEFDRIQIIATGLSDSIITLDAPQLSHTLHLNLPPQGALHGFRLLKGDKGLTYNVIGNNGATYSSYLGVDGFAEGVGGFSPTLIIISMGTNEAFGKTGVSEMKDNIRSLVARLRSTCPDAKFLLTTPSECQRRITTRRRRGKRRSRRTTYIVNTNVKLMREAIMAFGREEHIPVYDFYEVAGGAGASAKWLSDRYLNKDRVHLTREGYTLQGNLFTDALEAALSIKNDSDL